MSTAETRLRQPRLRPSIGVRLLMLLVVLTTISVLTVGYLGVNSVQSAGASAQSISSQALRTQSEDYLRQITVGDAQRNDLILQRVQQDAGNVAQTAADIFENAAQLSAAPYWRSDDHMFRGADGQWMNGEEDASSVFVPVYAEITPDVVRDVELGGYLDLTLKPVFDSDPNTVAIYLATEHEVTRYHPNISLGSVVPPDFTVTGRPWYVSANPENNPDRRVVWSEVYADATGKGLLVTAAAPVYSSDDQFLGVVGIDVTLGAVTASVEETRLLGGGYSFMIDNSGQAVALPEAGYPDILGRPAEPDEVGADLSQATTSFAPIVSQMLTGAAGFQTLEAGDRELFVAYAPLEVTGWSLANVVEADAVLMAMRTLQGELESSTRSLVLARILPVGGAILLAMVVIGLLFTNRLARPIRRIAQAAQQIGTGDWDVPLPAPGNDEIGVLSRAFRTMTDQLRQLLTGLEHQVEERTTDLARRTTQLETAAQVAREAAAIQDLDDLLNQAVNLISERFGFYHAGIFLVDPARQFAALRAASSEGGRRMLARGHQLKVGEVGIVGFVAGRGEPRIALDVGQDAVFFDNPDLPETRSEMGLPLAVHGEVIGVLDVQSTEPAAFTDEDVAVLQTMADQIAVAISNARLLRQAQESLEAQRRVYGELSRTAWHDLLQSRRGLYGRYDPQGILPPPDGPTPDRVPAGQMEKTAEGEEVARPTLTLPLKINQQVVGVLKAYKPSETDRWEADEVGLMQNLVDQLGLALDSARLHQEAQLRAAREQMTSQVVSRMRESLEVDTVLRTAASEIRQSLELDRVIVRLKTDGAAGSARQLVETAP